MIKNIFLFIILCLLIDCNSYYYKEIKVNNNFSLKNTSIFLGYKITKNKKEIDKSIFNFDKNDIAFDLEIFLEALRVIDSFDVKNLNSNTSNKKQLEIIIQFNHFDENKYNSFLSFWTLGFIPRYEVKEIELKAIYKNLEVNNSSEILRKIGKIQIYNGFFPNLLEPLGNKDERLKFYENMLKDLINEIE